MSLPTSVFLDTSVFASQQYNFDSIAIASFVPAAKQHGLKFLLPDPTEREIGRHMKERSQEALKALEDARRRAPFLAKWRHFPVRHSGSLADWEVSRVAAAEWNAFLRKLDATRLDYSGVDVASVMRWYDVGLAPFGEGKKKKEFPDAFAIAILDVYARAHGCVIAVVSLDADFKHACERFPSLLYFNSLPVLTELLLLDPAKRDRLRGIIEADLSVLEAAVCEEGSDTEWYHRDGDFEVRESRISGASVTDARIVALGHEECTLVFEAEMEAEHLLRWTIRDSYTDEPEEHKEWTSEVHSVRGTAKASVDLVLGKIKHVSVIESDSEELEVTQNPRSGW